MHTRVYQILHETIYHGIELNCERSPWKLNLTKRILIYNEKVNVDTCGASRNIF